MARIVCIEEDAGLRQLLGMVLDEDGFDTALWPAADGARAFVRRERPDLLLTELRLGGAAEGLRLIESLRAEPETAALPVIVCSGDLRLLRRHGRALRALDCTMLEKPFTACELLAAVRRATDPAGERGVSRVLLPFRRRQSASRCDHSRSATA